MKGVFINCPECKGMMMKNAYLRPGSFCTNKCFNCGSLIEIRSEPNRITLHQLSTPSRDLTNDEEDDIMFIHS